MAAEMRGCRRQLTFEVSRQDSKGECRLANTFNGKYLFDIVEKGRPSKWITLSALRVLKGYYG